MYHRTLFVWTWLLLLAPQIGMSTEPFKVLTYNIRYQNTHDGPDIWENRKETVVQTIKEGDIAGLQEVLASQYDYVASETHGWQWYGLGRSDGIRDGEMAALGWKRERFIGVEQGTFWLSEHPYQVGRSGWDAALPRVASWARLVDRRTLESDSPHTLLVINVHFDHQGELARKNSGKLLREWIAFHRRDSQVLLIGDMNATVDSPPMQALLSDSLSNDPPLIDTRLTSREPDSGPNSTWNAFRQIEAGKRIDHVLMQGDQLRVERYQTLDPKTPNGRFASDHLPILVELTHVGAKSEK